MSEFTQALGLIAPVYNLALVFILMLLFGKLFKTYKRTSIGNIKPWVLIFVAMLIYIAEAVFTVVRSMGVFHLPYHVNGYFELAIITLFIYALLLKREEIKRMEMPSVFSEGLPILKKPKQRATSKTKASKRPTRRKVKRKGKRR